MKLSKKSKNNFLSHSKMVGHQNSGGGHILVAKFGRIPPVYCITCTHPRICLTTRHMNLVKTLMSQDSFSCLF